MKKDVSQAATVSGPRGVTKLWTLCFAVESCWVLSVFVLGLGYQEFGPGVDVRFRAFDCGRISNPLCAEWILGVELAEFQNIKEM
jgi:hypothetical protein